MHIEEQHNSATVERLVGKANVYSRRLKLSCDNFVTLNGNTKRDAEGEKLGVSSKYIVLKLKNTLLIILLGLN